MRALCLTPQQPLQLWADGFNASIITWGETRAKRSTLVLGDNNYEPSIAEPSSSILGSLLKSTFADGSALLGGNTDASHTVGISVWIISGDREEDLLRHALDGPGTSKSSLSEQHVSLAVRSLDEAERVMAAARDCSATLALQPGGRTASSSSLLKGYRPSGRSFERAEVPVSSPRVDLSTESPQSWDHNGREDAHIFVQLTLIRDRPVKRVSSLTLVDLAEPPGEPSVEGAAEGASTGLLRHQMMRFRRLLSELSILHSSNGKRVHERLTGLRCRQQIGKT